MMPDKTIAAWFKQEVFFWRLVHSVFCVVGVQIVVAIAVTFFLSGDIFHPVIGINGGLRATFSLAFVGYSILLSALTVCLVSVHAYRFKVVPSVYTSIWRALLVAAQPKSLVVLLGYSVIGGVFVWIYLGASRILYSGLTAPALVDGAQHRLNEFHLFLVLHGVFIGFLYALDTVIGNSSCVVFPIIQRSKFTQIKSGLWTKLRDSARRQVRDVKWFLIFYAVCGLSLEDWITRMLHLNNGDVSKLVLLYNLLSVKLWWTWFLTGTALSFVLDAISFIFGVFQTERIVFPIESPFDEEAYRTLRFALGSSDIPLLQHLGYLDLNNAAQKSPFRVKEIFSISQPGGHPHHWNHILKECFALIKSFNDRLREFSDPPVPIPPAKPSSSPAASSGHLYSLQASDRSPDVCRMRSLTTPNLSLNGSPRFSPIQPQAASPVLPPALQPVPVIISSLKISLQKKSSQIFDVFQNMPGVAYFVKESNESRARRLFADCQIHIWALEALSFIVSASYTTDKYGVVQRDMPEIMQTLLDVQQAVNKIQKIDIHSTKRAVTSILVSQRACLSQSLRCTIKLSIYRIATVFKYDLSFLDLARDYERKIESYVQFQE